MQSRGCGAHNINSCPPNHPLAGLLVVRGALPPAQQRGLVADAFTHFNEPPNHTTHIRAYPSGLPGIWAAAQAGLRLQQPASGSSAADGMKADGNDGSGSSGSGSSGSAGTSIWGPGGSGPTAESLLRKLRWATLGPPYDWTQRRYLREAPHTPLPGELRELAIALARMAEQLLADGGSRAASTRCNTTNTLADSSAAAVGREQPLAQQQGCCQRPAAPYSPDAAIVNFYYEGKLGAGGGRLDRPGMRLCCPSDRWQLLASPGFARSPAAPSLPAHLTWPLASQLNPQLYPLPHSQATH